MEIGALPLAGAAIIDTESFADHRGTFSRFFCHRQLAPLLGEKRIEQINFSRTDRPGTVRGLHYQRPPASEMKFVRCVRGEIFDVLVDLREDSPTYAQWHGAHLSAETMQMLCIPEGFAHGFQSLQENCEVIYLVTHPYAPECEAGLRYDDRTLNIRWPLQVTNLSEKDARLPILRETTEIPRETTEGEQTDASFDHRRHGVHRAPRGTRAKSRNRM